MMGNRGFARAVGNALHKNPDGEKYPCFKVVNAKGELAPAFVFGGIEEQKRRLEAEGIEVKDGRVDLEKYGYRLF
jgi:alkylated DNA nucleotide flippase Atl1